MRNRCLHRHAAGLSCGTVKLTGKIGGRVSVLAELIAFLWQQRLWWMIPMVVVLVLFGTLMVLAQGSALSPFIYTLF